MENDNKPKADRHKPSEKRKKDRHRPGYVRPDRLNSHGNKRGRPRKLEQNDSLEPVKHVSKDEINEKIKEQSVLEYLDNPELIPVKFSAQWRSLSQFIEKHSEIRYLIPDLKGLLVDQYERPIDWDKNIITEFQGTSLEAGIIGMAFDYVARALVANKCQGNVEFEDILIAKFAFLGLDNKIRRRYLQFKEKSDKISKAVRQDESLMAHQLSVLEDVYKNTDQIMIFLKQKFNDIEIRRKEFSTGAVSLQELITDALFLARLEEVYRSPSPASITVVEYFYRDQGRESGLFYNKKSSDEEMIMDINNMVSVFETFIKKNALGKSDTKSQV